MHILFALLFATAIQITAPVWKDAPPALPPGTKIAVLEGDTHQPGIFTMRLKVPAGSVIKPHTHPRSERVTVLSGKVKLTIGGKETTFESGGFYVNPPNEVHSVFFQKTSVVQLTCEGPWVIDYVGD